MKPEIDGIVVVSGLPTDPTGRMGLSGSLEIITVGLGTGKWEYHFTLFTALNYCIRDTLTGQSNINRTGSGGSDGATE